MNETQEPDSESTVEIKDAAKILGVSIEFLNRALKTNKIKCVRMQRSRSNGSVKWIDAKTAVALGVNEEWRMRICRDSRVTTRQHRIRNEDPGFENIVRAMEDSISSLD